LMVVLSQLAGICTVVMEASNNNTLVLTHEILYVYFVIMLATIVAKNERSTLEKNTFTIYFGLYL
jgi:hypothetical protein